MKRFLAAFAFLCLVPFSARAAGPIYISEVAWAASSLSTADEWLEVCGPSGTDISGWKIDGAAANGLLLPDGSVIPASGAFLISNYSADDPKSTLAALPDFVTTSVALSNANLFLVLQDPSGAVIDIDGASGSAPLAGTSGGIKASMARVVPLLSGDTEEAWVNSSSSTGFDPDATELGTPGTCMMIENAHEDSATTTPPAALVIAPSLEEPPASNPPNEPMSAMRISETYPAPLSGENEWIELVNPSATGELLEGWTIEDGKGTVTKLSGLLLPWERMVIASPKGSLNNDGDLVILKDARGRIVDGVAYGAWDTALYPRIGNVKKGFSLIRIELQDTFDVTETPTPGAANILTRTVEKAEETLPLSFRPERSEVEESMRPKTDPSATLGMTKVEVRSVQDDKKTLAVKTAPKPPTQAVAKSKYKGSAYTAVIAVPPGVYSKTRFYIMTPEAVREVRLSKSSGTLFTPGQRISFVAQSKTENGDAFLLANPNSIRALDRSASTTFAAITAWPNTPGAYAFTAEVIALKTGGMEVRVNGAEGDVLLPSAISALKPGDRVTIEGFVSPGVRPRVVLPGNAFVRLLASSPVELSPRDLPRTRLSWPTMALLTFVAVGAGFVVYVRGERLKRLALVAAPIEEDFS